MGTATFRRHTRARVDAAIHNTFGMLRDYQYDRSLFDRLLRVARDRSDLMSTPPVRGGEVVQSQALLNLSWFERDLVRAPEDWIGATGHPLCVVDALASHLFGRYPTPRFLGWAWFGDRAHATDDQRWYIAHAQGQRFRRLSLPIAMTRRMEHVFLRTPDHVRIGHALRRAEVLGLGGGDAVAEVVLATRLGDCFDDAGWWRVVIQWLVSCGDRVDLAQVRPVIDFLQANRHAIELRGRSFVSVMRQVADWHDRLGRQQVRMLFWPRSPWRELVVRVEPTQHEPNPCVWSIVELLDSGSLAREGREMRHCVATYAKACAAGVSSIWSLRHRWAEEDVTRSILTIEVSPRSRCIVQLRGKANSKASGSPLQLVQRWAAREGLRFHRGVAVGDGVVLQQAA